MTRDENRESNLIQIWGCVDEYQDVEKRQQGWGGYFGWQLTILARGCVRDRMMVMCL